MEKRMDNLNESTMLRFLQGECTEDELRELKDWMDKSDDNARELFKTEEIYHLGKCEDESDSQQMQKAEQRLMERLEQEQARQSKRRKLFVGMRYAAMLAGAFLLGALGYLLLLPQAEPEEPLLTVNTTGKMKMLKLPDGTKVWLNKHTELKYPRSFANDHRTVYLEGEGYFEVTKNPEKPFVVQSEAMQVRVLGTTFNLKSDKEHMSAVATLIEGEVIVKGNHDEGMIALVPGQKAELNGRTKRLRVKQVDTGISNWYSDEFIFNKADIYTIARTLESSYEVRVILSPDVDTSKTYSGTLKKKNNVKVVLDQLTNTIPVTYKIVGNNVFLSPK